MKSNLASIVVAALVALFAGLWVINNSAEINKKEIWFSNMDQDSVVLMETLRVQANRTPDFVEHPALGNYVLYGLGFKALKAIGVIDFDNYTEFMNHPDPILNLKEMYLSGRTISIGLAISVALFVALAISLFARSALIGFISFAVLVIGSGLLLQSLIIRTELSSMVFVGLSFFSLACLYRIPEGHFGRWFAAMFSGLFLGMAVLTKIVALPLLLPLGIAVVLISYKWTPAKISRRQKQNLSALTLLATGTIYYYFLHALGPDALQDTQLGLIIPLLTIGSVASLFAYLLPWPRIAQVFQTSILTILGYFMATPLLFKLCSINHPYYTRYIVNIAFSRNMLVREGPSGGSMYASRWNNFEALFEEFFFFLGDGWSQSNLIIFAIIGIVLARSRPIRLTGILCLLSGIGMSLVMSARSYGSHYLIYQEIFLTIAACLGIGEFLIQLDSPNMKRIAFILVLVVTGIEANRYLATTKRVYSTYNSHLRNDITYVPHCLYTVREFQKDFRDTYGSPNAIMERVLSDRRLNGSEDGIDLMSRPNIEDIVKRLDLKTRPMAISKGDLNNGRR